MTIAIKDILQRCPKITSVTMNFTTALNSVPVGAALPVVVVGEELDKVDPLQPHEALQVVVREFGGHQDREALLEAAGDLALLLLLSVEL